MICTIYFRKFFAKNHFAEALSRYRHFPVLKNAKSIYAAYRLGLYETVANSCNVDISHWQAGFAQAVSLAACGRNQEAKEKTFQLLSKNFPAAQKAVLADALAPFHPKLACRTLGESDAPPVLRAALLLRTGELKKAATLLGAELSTTEGFKNPELFLFQSNAIPMKPHQQLENLNRFLANNNLPPLELRNPSFAPSPTNLGLAQQLPFIRGPLVSILMTAYNSEDRIETAITSLLDQTYQDIEVIVVDDASNDKTGDIIQALARKDPRVVYVRLPRNVGTYVAKNIGLQKANGVFVTCHDSDDWTHPLRIERQVTPLLKNKRLVFTTSHWVRMQDNGLYYARPVHPLMRINPASPMFRHKQVLEHAGGWDPVRTGADSEFLARLKLVFGRRAMYRVLQPLTLGSHRPNSLMTAADTGYSSTGMSSTRLLYWEAWNYWHIGELREGRKPNLKNDLMAGRKFCAPESIKVPTADIQHCLKNFN